MPNYFFDSSALVKLYHPEMGTSKVEALFRTPDNRIIISRLTIVELESALSTKVRTGAISPDEKNHASTKILQHGRDRVFRVVAVRESHFSDAKKLIVRYGVQNSLRTLDAIQLSVALDLHQRALVDFIVSADQTLAAVARAEGLPAIDPLTPPTAP